MPELTGLEPQLYGGRDPLIPSQKIPKGEIDVAAIARSVPSQSGEKRLLAANSFRQFMNGDEPESRHTRNAPRKQHLRHLAPAIVPGEGWASESSS